ncbi:unnamed protein product [Psylliodes chrysocephalus]|uniref:Cathepsin propeptide inhibitor domain-containing protein n=1 Tax=Psylliodes chrysocephalus TaxID=3402493 RepID=A0A9P0CJB6_9CUCU|nr:unnamed protein product [Psylliodes chrysocephala]
MSDTVQDKWKNFKVAHNKNYANQEEEDHRFGIFQENLKKIEEHNERFNKGDETYTLGVNKFADLTTEEMKNFKGFAPKHLQKPT